MKDQDRIKSLAASLGAEIQRISAGSTEGQFPILDLIGNLRDETASEPTLAAIHAASAEAWETMVRIVESGQAFSAENIEWIKGFFARIESPGPVPATGMVAELHDSAAPSPEPDGLSPAREPKETIREGSDCSHPSPSIPLPVEGRGKILPGAVEPPRESGGPSPHPGPLPSHRMGAERESAFAQATADRQQAAGSGGKGANLSGISDPAKPGPSNASDELPLNLNVADDADLLREFISESREHLDNIEQGVLVLEQHPDNAETLNTVFRAFHTFKGGAGFLNLVPINRLAHILESLLDLARQGKFTIGSPTIEIILRGRDVLKQFLDEIEKQVNGSKPAATIIIPTEALKASVRDMIDQVSSGKMPEAPAPDATAAVGEAPAAPVAEAAASGAASSAGNANAMVRVDTSKLDGLLDLVGEMVIAQSLVAPDLSRLADGNAQFSRNVAQLNRITRDLQRVSMSLRMVPIRGLFQKMARVSRDISTKQNKKVNFVTSGEDTELDRTVVEELNDPLLHMIRNSMDHGIEHAEKRAAAGKPAVGSLQLRAYHQGGNIVVEIEDDGAGLNRERILAKAVERGLVAPNAHLSDEEIYHFIFAAGFSTAEKVTDLSGRGVGLDVVRRNIEKLRGTVNISSTAGKGALFKIALPLTLAIIDGLVVGVGAERYILPTLSVRESFRPTPEMISRVQNRAELVNVRGRLIPLLRLHEIFGIQARAMEATDGIVVVVQSGTTLRCLLVDALLHKQEVVIKNLNEMMIHKNPAFAGATILGDGRVGLILDVNALAQQEKGAFAKAA
ncbi:MAG: chemotaxis protein CheW [Limisphaerales bacterium]